MSFALTADAIAEKRKTVTRRLGWTFLKPGYRLLPVRKSMGRRKGEALDILGDPITVVSVRREPLRRMLDEAEYGFEECQLEGFAYHPELRWPSGFVAFFCASHRGCTSDTEVTRIEFSYGEPELHIGYRVKTLMKTMPTSIGHITKLSSCGRYAIVTKEYGTRCRFEEWHRTENLKFVAFS